MRFCSGDFEDVEGCACSFPLFRFSAFPLFSFSFSAFRFQLFVFCFPLSPSDYFLLVKVIERCIIPM